MDWQKGDLHEVQLGRLKKHPHSNSTMIAYTSFQIPAPYDWIISQLIAEDLFIDKYYSHETHHQWTYARTILDAFSEELLEFKKKGLKSVNFHSRVLTPILQHQLGGVFGAYSPTVCTGINSIGAMLSIQDVTEFYLQVDPVDPVFTQSYC